MSNKNIRLVQMNNGVLVEHFHPAPTTERLPAAMYRLQTTDKTVALIHVDPYPMPTKIYGDHHRRKELILDTLSRRVESVGVLLLGMKGTGKSVLAYDLCNEAVKNGHPVFVIDHTVPASMLTFLYELVNGECVFLFDEFNKRYAEKSEQDDLLTFFSDAKIQKALFLITQNEADKLPDAFLNRTGRFLFRFEYSVLKRSEAKEIIDDLIVDPETGEFLLDYVDQQALSPNMLIDLIRQIQSFGGRYDLGYLLNVMNVPRPVWVNVEWGIAFDPENPLPKGWGYAMDRRDAKNAILYFVTETGSRIRELDVEYGLPEVGRGGEYSTIRTSNAANLPSKVKYYIHVKTLGVGVLSDYRPPVEVQVLYPEKETESADE